jgi:hypothetical protein
MLAQSSASPSSLQKRCIHKVENRIDMGTKDCTSQSIGRKRGDANRRDGQPLINHLKFNKFKLYFHKCKGLSLKTREIYLGL